MNQMNEAYSVDWDCGIHRKLKIFQNDISMPVHDTDFHAIT